MVNSSKEIRRSNEEDLQRYDELEKLFDLLKNEWPECFDNISQSYLSRAQIAVSLLSTYIMHGFISSLNIN